MFVVMLATLTLAAGPTANWQLLFRDPAQGSVYVDRASVWTRGAERAVTARFTFDRPAATEVAEIITRIEVDCADRSFRSRTATAFDRNGAEIYGYEFDAGRPATRANPAGPASRLVAMVCSPAAANPGSP